jgi:Uma2 family endonuclease
MSTVPKKLLSEDEYLAIERAAAFKSEFYRGEMFAMAGTSHQHARIKHNIERRLGEQLEGGPCEVASSDLRVRVSANGLYTYPDVVVICGETEYADDEFDTVLNPRVVFEILSDSTESYDRGEKFNLYKGAPSLQEYVLVSQRRAFVEAFVRQPNNRWLQSTAEGLDSSIALSSVEVRLSLAEVYARVIFPPLQLRSRETE